MSVLVAGMRFSLSVAIAATVMLLPASALALLYIYDPEPAEPMSVGKGCSMSYKGGGQKAVDSSARHIDEQLVFVWIMSREYDVVPPDAEHISVYYRCDMQEAVWFGGDRRNMGLADPEYFARWGVDPDSYPGNSPFDFPPYIMDLFGEIVRKKFAPDYPLDAILAEAQAQPWIPYSGKINSNRISVDGKMITLSCGCTMPVERLD